MVPVILVTCGIGVISYAFTSDAKQRFGRLGIVQVGFQYTSKIFKFKLDEAGMIQSMSRVGKCIDNGPMEGFWGTLKSESFYGLKFENETALRLKIDEYIFFYNNFRLQRNLKGMTPNELRYHAYSNYIYF